MRPLVGIVILVLLGVFAAFVALRNGEAVEIHLVFASIPHIPLWLALFGAAVIGAILTGIACSWPMVRLRLEVHRQHRRITGLEQEIHGLRTLPLEDETHSANASAREG